MFVGLLLLLLTNGVIRAGELAVLVLFSAVGLIAVINAFMRQGRDAQLLVGTFLVLTALFLTARATLLAHAPLTRVWPGFVTVGGLSLFGYAMTKGSDYRVALAVPAVVLVFLSGVFFLFSLDLVEINFIEFVLAWWPVLIVAAGVVTVWRQVSPGSSD